MHTIAQVVVPIVRIRLQPGVVTSVGLGLNNVIRRHKQVSFLDPLSTLLSYPLKYFRGHLDYLFNKLNCKNQMIEEKKKKR